MSQSTSAGFLATMLDFSFNHFVTTKFVKIIYAFVIAVQALVWFGIAAAIGLDSGFLAFLGGLIMAAIGFAVAVTVSRIMLELVVVVFRIADHSREIATQSRIANARSTETITASL